MRYTIIITENGDNYFSAEVLEMPECKINKAKSIKGAITNAKKSICCSCLFYFLFYKYLDVVFNSKDIHNNSEGIHNNKYYYTLNDKRDDFLYLINRIFVLLILVFFIHFIPYKLYKVDYIVNYFKDINILETCSYIVSVLSIIWAVQSYWRLKYIDKQSEMWRPNDVMDKWSSPFTFHVLAESHKQWAELWFCWCVALFSSGITYAIFMVINHFKQYDNIIYNEHGIVEKSLSWPNTVHDLISGMAPSGFIYLLFGFSCYWSLKQYRSHWHNFVINAYRHRALYRLENLRDDIKKGEHKFLPNHKADETILELYRLSGVLLLIPGDSSYLDKIGSEEITKTLLQMEEITKAFTNKTANP